MANQLTMNAGEGRVQPWPAVSPGGRPDRFSLSREAGVAMWKKVVAPTVVVSVLWVLVSCGTSWILSRIDGNQTDLLNQNRNVTRAAGIMQEDLWQCQTMLLEAAEHRKQAGELREKFKIEAKQVQDDFDRALALAKGNASTTAEQALIQTISQHFASYRATSSEELARGGLSHAVTADSVDAAMQLARTVAQPCEELSDLAQRLTNDSFHRRDSVRAKVEFARISFIIIGPAIGIFLGVWVARGLQHSISEISVTLRDASGNLSQEIGKVEVRPSAEFDSLPALQQQVQYVSGSIKRVVEELQRARREAVRSERLAAVGQLAAGIAHEVRNPLTSVKLLMQAIERNQAPESSDMQRLQIVQQEIARIETTMQELLDYARPPKLHRVRHDVRETVRRALNLAAGRAQQGGIIVDENLGSQAMTVDADPDQLQQVFINLLLNAIEATPAGGNLRVAIEPGEPAPDDSHANSSGEGAAGRTVRITFRDTGSGIRPDVMERLFEPFVTSKECGIGLGLAISRQIMQEHGGQLTACNPPPRGAMFVVELPLISPAGPDEGAARSATTLAHAASPGDASE